MLDFTTYIIIVFESITIRRRAQRLFRYHIYGKPFDSVQSLLFRDWFIFGIIYLSLTPILL